MKLETIVLNAKGKSLGRIASEAAALLRGKSSPSFERHIVSHQRVDIVNAGSVRFSGRKLNQKTRERYSGYPGGLKKIPYSTEFKKNPARFIEKAISGMLPSNRLKKQTLKNLKVYVGDKN